MQTNTSLVLGDEVKIVNALEPMYIPEFISEDIGGPLEVFVRDKLSKVYWRLNHLYTIIDKEDNKIIMKMNFAQNMVFSVKHPKTITLKSRQQGISTFKVAEGLDRCMYNSNTQAGIQSYGRSEAYKLYKKALLMWTDYDQEIIEILGITLVSANQEGLTFSNGSTLKIGNFRGDSLSFLHVSELAKIAVKFPEKAEELNTGAFEAVSTKSNISIESTAEGSSGLFFEIWEQAELRLSLVGAEGMTPLDFYPIFLSWLDDPDCNMEEYYEPTKDNEAYFRNVEKETGRTLTQSQRNWAAAKLQRLRENFGREYPHTPESAFRMSIKGTILKDEYEALLASGRIKPEIYSPGHPVTVSYDIGVDDSTVLLFTQTIRGRPKIVDLYSNKGKGVDHYIDVMDALQDSKGYEIEDVILPHDGSVQEWGSGRTRIERFLDRDVPARILPRVSVTEGVEATRQYLSVCTIDSSLNELLVAIQQYRWQYDKKLQVHLLTPLHDWTSNYLDAVKYMALGTHYDDTIDTTYQTPKRNHSSYAGV